MKKAWRKLLIPRRCAAGTQWGTGGYTVHGMQGTGVCLSKATPGKRGETPAQTPRAGREHRAGYGFWQAGGKLYRRAHARKRVLPIRPSASCLWIISCVPEARPLQHVNSVSMIHMATILPPGFPKGPAGPFWPCGRRVGIGGGFSVPFWRQKGTCNASRPAGAGSSGQARRFPKPPKPPAAGR